MEIVDSPSEQNITDGLKIVSYAVNRDGDYELVPDFVWQPVHVVNDQAWQEIERQVTVSRRKVEEGRVSPLHYYMTLNQMDCGLLARYTGQPRWKVRLHLIPFVFSRLSTASLEKYAELYGISPDDLAAGRLRPPLAPHE